jgi:hypothetical protein
MRYLRRPPGNWAARPEVHMRTLSALLLFGLVATTGVSHADFKVLQQDSPAVPTHSAGVDQQSTASPPRPAPPRFLTVYGFGREIPLAFAVRQIVPPLVKVTWGLGVDMTALVDWQGSRPWNAVLRDTVRPLGLRLTMHPMEVTISR